MKRPSYACLRLEVICASGDCRTVGALEEASDALMVAERNRMGLPTDVNYEMHRLMNRYVALEAALAYYTEKTL